MNEGIVYILTNEAMPGFVKIGLTRQDDVSARMKQLDNTSIPMPFELHYAARVNDCAKLERTLHFVFGESRARRSREFFKINPDLAKAIIELVAVDQIQLTDEEQSIDAAERMEINEARQRREVRTFRTLNIPNGAELVFLKDSEITCTVTGARTVLFRGDEMSPSAAALKTIHEMGYDWKSVSGMDYWTYRGHKLSSLDDDDETDIERESSGGEQFTDLTCSSSDLI
ncbi:MAG: GIY-YIG nuclease family protein [Sphingomonadaceae bacterium]